MWFVWLTHVEHTLLMLRLQRPARVVLLAPQALLMLVFVLF